MIDFLKSVAFSLICYYYRVMPEPGAPDFEKTRGVQKPIEGLTIEGVKQPVTRRVFTIGGAAVAAIAAFKKFGLDSHQAQSHESSQVDKEREKLDNELILIQRAEAEGPLSYTNGNVAQYYDVAIEGNPNLNQGLIHVRNEPTTNSKAVQEVTNREMSTLTLGAIRCASKFNNESANANDGFYDKSRGDMYEWLVLGNLTGDPAKPFEFKDGYGQPSENPWFVSPVFASLNTDSMQYISMPKTEAVE